MENVKKSFLVHIDSLNVLDELTDEQAGKLFKAIKDYQNGVDINLDFGMKMAFLPFKNQFIRDSEKYKVQCEINSKNGKLGGRPKKTNESEKTESVIIKAKKADSDSDSDNDNDNESVSKMHTHTGILGIDYILSYQDTSEEFKSMYKEEFYKSWLTINRYLNEECKYLRTWNDQITIAQYKMIYDKISKGEYSIQQAKQALSDLDGSKQAKEKYNSVYHGFNTYIKFILKNV